MTCPITIAATDTYHTFAAVTTVMSMARLAVPNRFQPKPSGSEDRGMISCPANSRYEKPVLEDEAGVYGYTDENRHMVECFRKGQKPTENFQDGLAVIEILMGLYRSAETGETVRFPAAELEDYVPPVARPAA